MYYIALESHWSTEGFKGSITNLQSILEGLEKQYTHHKFKLQVMLLKYEIIETIANMQCLNENFTAFFFKILDCPLKKIKQNLC